MIGGLILLWAIGETSTVAASIEEITVTASRRTARIRDVPAAVTVISRAELERDPSLTTDAVLRSVPGAQTFRRSSSMIADPTSQGLNLRGVGPSAVSRTLVLVNGVPANDPFAGSIYWRALPRLGLERIELVPGGGSASYGSAALGGVVELFERPIDGDGIEVDLSAGTQRTAWLGARATVAGENARGSVETELGHTGGYVSIAPEIRGPIDRAAPSSHAVLLGRAELEPFDDVRVSTHVTYFAEQQNSGTQLSGSDLELIRGDLRLSTGRKLCSTFTFDGGMTQFEQTRSRVSMERDSETLSATQIVPSNEQGASWVLTLPDLQLFGVHRVLVGVEGRRVAGESRERIGGSNYRVTGGEQHFLGVFIENSYSPSASLEMSAAVRADLVDGSRSRGEVSPRLGARWSVHEDLILRGSIYRAFRAPTLSELYRPFQVGTVRTAANDALREEQLLGGELGVEISPFASWLVFRATGFISRLDDPIVNATLSEPLPDGSTRQRQNLGQALIRGVESAVEARPMTHLSLRASYTFVDARVTEHPALVGKRLVQDPAHRAAASIAYRDPSLLFAEVELKILGAQFEDDLNTLPLDAAIQLSASLGVPIAEELEVYLAGENLLDQNYLVGRAGIDTIGAPRSVRAGVRLRKL